MYCIQIQSQFLGSPLHLVKDTVDYTATLDGNQVTYIACPFDIRLPRDFDKQDPTTELRIANVSKALTDWIERSQGAPETNVRLLVYLKETPGILELDCLFLGKQIVIDQQTVRITLGYDRLINKAAQAVRYTKYYSPGLY